MRYAEEVELLEEEMRRVLQFLHWRAESWRSLVELRAGHQHEETLHEGHAAYAHKQAGYMEGLRAQFEGQWQGVGSLLRNARALHATMEPDDKDEEGEEEEDRGADSGWLSD